MNRNLCKDITIGLTITAFMTVPCFGLTHSPPQKEPEHTEKETRPAFDAGRYRIVTTVTSASGIEYGTPMAIPASGSVFFIAPRWNR